MSDSENKKKKNKKINRMSLKELTDKIEETTNKMGGLHSKYASELEKRKTALEK